MNSETDLKKYSLALLSFAVFFVFTGYVFLNARLKENYGLTVMLFLVLLVLPRLAEQKGRGYRKFFVSLFWAFFGLSFASVLFPPSEYANMGWLVMAFLRLVCSSIIIMSMLNLSEADRIVLRWGLAICCLVLAGCSILQQVGYGVQEALGGLSPFKIDQSMWHEKNLAIWQLLLMWGSIALLWRRSVFSTGLACLVALVSIIAVFLSSSESAQLAAAAGMAVFILVHFLQRDRGQMRIMYIGLAGVLLVPFLWVCLAPVKPLLGSLLPDIEAITNRMDLYDYTASLIHKELVLGYGFGSTLFMQVPPEATGFWFTAFPGGHTHNLVLQFFVDHGLLGLIMIASLTSLLFYYVFETATDERKAPAIWSLLFSGFILFSLSYSIWMADIVLIYCMWLSLIFVALSDFELVQAPWLRRPAFYGSCMGFGALSIFLYGLDYLVLAGN